MENQIKEESCQPLLDLSTRTRRSSCTQTLWNIVVSILGAGILGIPFAFRVAGWIATSVALLFIGLVCYYSMLLLEYVVFPFAFRVANWIAVSGALLFIGLVCYYSMLLHVESRRKLEEAPQTSPIPTPTQSFGDVGSNAFGPTGRILTESMILVAHTGASIAILLFIAQNISSLSTSHVRISSITILLFLLLPLELALSFIRSLFLLAPFSAFATFCNICAIVIVIKEDMNHLKHDHSSFGSRSGFNGVKTIPFVCGVAVYCFQGFGMTLPLEGAMKSRRKFPLVLMLAFVGLIVVYICFGGVGYLAFGDETKEIITLNLTNSWSTVLVKIGLCIGCVFTFPLIVHPIHEIMELKLNSNKWFQNHFSSSHSKGWLVSQLARLLVVLALTILATSTPGFAQLISFTGSTICTLISFILPPLFHLKIMGSSLCLLRRVIDYLILLFGLVFASYCTCSTIRAAL